ncbi:hypothetical protein Hanom_Chr00s000004g01606321 [Helianthus anomalus]
MFFHITIRTKFLVYVCSFIKRMNVNELNAEWFTNCLLNVRFVYSTKHTCGVIFMSSQFFHNVIYSRMVMIYNIWHA